jgi:hypothetical protein
VFQPTLLLSYVPLPKLSHNQKQNKLYCFSSCFFTKLRRPQNQNTVVILENTNAFDPSFSNELQITAGKCTLVSKYHAMKAYRNSDVKHHVF